MARPTFGYARANDGAYLGYLVAGDGPVDIVWQLDWLGDVELTWENPTDRPWFEALAEIGRVILHDRRGTGLSSRHVPAPDLETRVGDTLAVMDALGAEQVVLGAALEGGAPNAMLAAARPERVRSVFWAEPVGRPLAAVDYPWGSIQAIDVERPMLEAWGTTEYGRRFLAYETAAGNELPEDDAERVARMSRHWCTPDVALELARIWSETDVRGVLPAIQAPVLLLAHGDRPGKREEMAYLATLLQRGEIRLMPGSAWTHAEIPSWIAEIRRFVGLDPPPIGLDTVLATVLFTDIVDSTQHQATIGDQAWKSLVERHHEVVRQLLERWHGVERDTAGDGFFATFDGPARAVRCAVELADRVRQLGLEIRAGVHTGECELIDGKAGGLAVSIGARVAGMAGPSEVLVSQTVKDLVAGSGLAFDDRGEHELKGVPDRWRLYRVVA